MKGKCWRLILCLIVTVFAGSSVWAQGPPFQIDDPVPVDLHHYEFYVFGNTDGTPAETDSTGPAFEFNWGAIPRVQLHAILPWGSINPSNNPVYLPGGTGPSAFGLTDMELVAGYSLGSTLLPSASRTTYSRGQLALSSCTSCIACPSWSREATKIYPPSPSLVKTLNICLHLLRSFSSAGGN